MLFQWITPTLSLLAVLTATSSGDDIPDCATSGSAGPLAIFPTPTDGSDPCDVESPRARCWQLHLDASVDGVLPNAPDWEGTGLPLQLDLAYGPASGDYLPRTSDPREGSLPMIPADIERHHRAEPGGDRPVLAGAVDLLTGVPLIQQVDLELPFGSAVYRHVRSYSETPAAFGAQYDTNSAMRTAESGRYWDWCGQGWMLAANPILLITGRQSAVVGADPPRAYFIPDAHHAIPFELDTSDPEDPVYQGQPRFGAVLTQSGGRWDPAADDWLTRPTSFTLSLHAGALRYTIKPRYDDVRSYATAFGDISGHRPPTGVDVGPMGIPFFGLVTQIEDRYGNRVEIEHKRGIDQWHVADTGLEDDGCWPCGQDCVDVGQVRVVKLYAASEPNAQWTLIFQHRRFNFSPTVGLPSGSVFSDEFMRRWSWLFTQTAVHSVSVFQRDVDVPGEIDPAQFEWVLPSDAFVHDDATGSEAPLSWLEETPVSRPTEGLPSDWTHRIVYTYSEAWRPHTLAEDEPPILVDAAEACPSPSGVPRLLMATTLTRTDDESLPPATRSHVYRYHPTNPDHAAALTHVFEPDDVARIVQQLQEHEPFDQFIDSSGIYERDPALHTAWTPVWLLRIRSDELLPIEELIESIDVFGSATVGYGNLTLDDAAAWRLHRSLSVVDRPTSPFTRDLVEDFIQLDNTRLVSLPGTDQDVVAVSSRSSDADSGHHRIHRFIYLPPAAEDPYLSLAAGRYLQRWGEDPRSRVDRTIMHVPYRSKNAAPPAIPNPSIRRRWTNRCGSPSSTPSITPRDSRSPIRSPSTETGRRHSDASSSRTPRAWCCEVAVGRSSLGQRT